MFSSDESFEIYLSSSVPKLMRYQLISSAEDECVRLGIYYANPNRLEVSVNGKFRMPNNGFIDAKGRFRLKTTNQDLPDVTNKVSGENLL